MALRRAWGERTVKRKANGEDRVATYADAGKLPGIVEVFENAEKAPSKAEIVGLKVLTLDTFGACSYRSAVPRNLRIQHPITGAPIKAGISPTC